MLNESEVALYRTGTRHTANVAALMSLMSAFHGIPKFPYRRLGNSAMQASSSVEVILSDVDILEYQQFRSRFITT